MALLLHDPTEVAQAAGGIPGTCCSHSGSNPIECRDGPFVPGAARSGSTRLTAGAEEYFRELRAEDPELYRRLAPELFRMGLILPG